MILPFIIHIPVLLFIAYIFWKKYAASPLIAFYWPALALKISSGIFIGLLYTFYYKGGDTIEMHRYATYINVILIDHPLEYFKTLLSTVEGEERVFFFMKIITLLNIITFNNYWINSLYFSGYMFISVYLLANSIVDIFKTSKIATAISFFFFPSFALWTSGVLKESFIIGSIAIIIKYFLDYLYLKKEPKYYEYIFLLTILYCSWQIKFYYLLVLLPVLISYFLAIKYEHFFKKKYLKFSFFFLSLLILISCAILIHPSLSYEWLINTIYDNYIITLNISHEAGKFPYEFSDFKPEITSFLIHLPKALIIGLFRPFLWESPFNFTLLVGFENLCIMTLFFSMIYYSIKNKPKFDITLIALFTYIGINAVFMVYIGPNWGTLVRYKTIFMPFWVLILLNKNPLLKGIESYFRSSQSKILSQ
jgi:hypothetical protein